MMGKLYQAVAALALAAVLAGGGFAAYLLGTGRLDAQRVEALAAVLRGDLALPTTQPTSAPAAEAPTPEPGAAGDLPARYRQGHLRALELERAAADLLAQRRLLEQVLAQILQEQERLVAQKTELAKQRETHKGPGRAAREAEPAEGPVDSGFQQELEAVAALPPRLAKEHLTRVWQKQPADAVRLLGALDERSRKRLLEQFKTPEELELLTNLLEQIRTQNPDAQPSRRTAGAAPP